MRIQYKNGNEFEVFGLEWSKDTMYVIYWDSDRLSYAYIKNGNSNENTEIEVVDDLITWKGRYCQKRSMFFHWALFDDYLYEEIMERENGATQKFYRILRSEGFLGEKDLQRCRICGLLQDDLPWGKDDNDPTYELCGCCGAVFGIDDLDLDSIRKYRNDWVLGGHKWNREQEKPEDWLPETQIIEIPFNYR